MESLRKRDGSVAGAEMFPEQEHGFPSAVVDGLEGDAQLGGDFLGLEAFEVEPDDSGQVGGWARDYIAAMVTRGIISGSNGKLDPNGTVTRAQVAKMLYNLY